MRSPTTSACSIPGEIYLVDLIYFEESVVLCSTARRKFSMHDDYLNKNVHPVKNAPSVNDPAERALMKYKKSIQLSTDSND
ncbi:hypothetical protein A3Q56_03316 [Intoshia linei]|uniref:Uncharacterized protein n=1 Tax=Intoshia linei TaxID=1819745 RepID=A0A177B3Y9_9BILA|nr:hypothetical protein A3Q56_03316 [Intoshia linei]